MSASPLVSVLIATYNRSRLLRRAVNSVLMQDFRDYELVIVDDCSPDDTREVVAGFNDARIRYIRNETNVGSQGGDRAILRRFVYELMRGEYFVYLCDDDYWLYPDLLSRQVAAFRANPNLAMAIGGQLAYFLSSPESYLGYPPDDTLTISLANLGNFFEPTTKTTRSPYFHFHGAGKPLFPTDSMTPEIFLSEFAADPTGKNIIGGAMLYSREIFIRSGTLKSPHGSRWQAGYELKIGPACYGDTVYFNEPSIVTEIRGSNASFQRTQAEHYLDSINSIEVAFQTPLADPQLRFRAKFLNQIKARTIRNLSRTFLINTLSIVQTGDLSLCSEENMRRPVTWRQIVPVLVRNRVNPKRLTLHLLLSAVLDLLRRFESLAPRRPNSRMEYDARTKPSLAAAGWDALPDWVKHRVRLLLGM
jgi:glycosyltransferase involved in cell wall biosynthesis